MGKSLFTILEWGPASKIYYRGTKKIIALIILILSKLIMVIVALIRPLKLILANNNNNWANHRLSSNNKILYLIFLINRQLINFLCLQYRRFSHPIWIFSRIWVFFNLIYCLLNLELNNSHTSNNSNT